MRQRVTLTRHLAFCLSHISAYDYMEDTKMKQVTKNDLENAFVAIAVRSHTEKDLSPKERLDRFWMVA